MSPPLPFSNRMHRLHHRNKQQRAIVQPAHDLILNWIFVYMFPTHVVTHRIKACTVLVAVVLSVILGAFLVEWPSVIHKAACLPLCGGAVLLLVWIMYYLWTVRRFIQSPGLHQDPTTPAFYQLDMHVPLVGWKTVKQARRAACRLHGTGRVSDEKTKTNDRDDPRILLDGNKWEFWLFTTVENALEFVTTQKNGTNESIHHCTDMLVPSNWTMIDTVPDFPIYTNQKYPWPCCPPLVPEHNPVGVYQTVLPPDLAQEETSYTVTLHGFESAAWVYVHTTTTNGSPTFIGFAKDSRLPSEFVLPPAAQKLIVVVARWSDGSYTEDQDDWWMAGLHRSVELRPTSNAIICDYHVQADGNGECGVRVQLLQSDDNNKSAVRTVRAQLFRDEQLTPEGDEWRPGDVVLTLSSQTDNERVVVMEGTVDSSDLFLWTAETPHLYTLVVDVADDQGRVLQAESCRVGFRTIDIVEGAVHVNGRPITVAGINRHEHDPDYGKVARWERMKQDICLLKQNNFNTVRTSHYPCHQQFYQLCDFYGLYVWDEANIETHGMKPMGRLAHDWGWEATFCSRVTRTVQRDRNHASIIMWSLGNEAGRGRNFRKARRLVEEIDSSRPIVYEGGGCLAEGTGRSELTDIISTMYPKIARTKHLATRKDEDRPVILCEYSHSMGNSNGNLHYYWEAFWNKDLPRLRGGCIWDMIDQGIRIPDSKNGGFYFGYGGDFGDKINDLQFCINGMFSPDREAHPSVSEIKFLQQPVLIQPSDNTESPTLTVVVAHGKTASVVLRATSRYTFRDLSHLAWTWKIISNRSTKPVHVGRFEIPNRDRRENDMVLFLDSAVQRVKAMLKTSQGATKFFLKVQGCLASTTTWAPAGHEIVHEQLPLVFEGLDTERKDQKAQTAQDGRVEAKETDSAISIVATSDREIAKFDKTNGSMVSYSPNGTDLFARATRQNFTRAGTDNDRGGLELTLNFIFPFKIDNFVAFLIGSNDFSFFSHWENVGLTELDPPRVTCTEMAIVESKGTRVVVVADCEVRSSRKILLFRLKLRYTVFVDGRVRISHALDPQRALRRTLSLPRVGVQLQLHTSLSQIQYFGRGPFENYPDRKTGAKLGLYDTSPSRMPYLGYIVPSENGSRSDCDWVAFRNDTEGLLVHCSSPETSTFSCGASLYTTAELEHASHTCDLPPRKYGPICVNVDHCLMGVGGDTSWFPDVYPEFRISSTRSYNYVMWLHPLEKGENPVDAWQRCCSTQDAPE